MSDKLSIASEMRAFDTKDRAFYDNLNDQERKKFSTYLIMKYGANVEGIPDLQEYYLLAHNQRVNENFFDLGRHPKLQWLLCTTVSPGMGTHRHFWLNPKKKISNAKLAQFLQDQFPLANEDEIELMIKLNSKTDIANMARSLGWDERRIKDEL